MKYMMIMPKLQEFEVDVSNTKKKMNQVNVFQIWKKSDASQGKSVIKKLLTPKK